MLKVSEGRHKHTRRNRDCRDVWLWHSARGRSGTEIEVSEMIGGLVRGLQPELTVETGTYLGQTSIAIGQALKANGHGRLVTIEPSARHHRYAARKCRNLPVQCVLGEALQWVPQPGETIDFIFFDSSWDSRLREFDHFYPHMNRFTILAWHDTGTQFRYFRNFILSLSRITTPLLLPTARGICLARAIK